MGTGICLVLDWENAIWVTGTGKHVCHYKDRSSWTFSEFSCYKKVLMKVD